MSETRHHTATWWLLPAIGIAWIVLSVVIIRFDYTSVGAVAVLFGTYCIIAAVSPNASVVVLVAWVADARHRRHRTGLPDAHRAARSAASGR